MSETQKTKIGVGANVREVEIEVPDGEPAIWGADAKLRVVGARVPRVDGPEKATGRAAYTSDIQLPGMLHARVFRSPRAGGTIASLDLSAAEKSPGVVAVRPMRRVGQPVLIDGDDLAMVIAETDEQARDAVGLCRVVIDAGPVYVTAEDAMKEGARSIHRDRGDNVRRGGRAKPEEVAEQFERADKAIAGADIVIERTYRTQVQTHSPLEPHGIVVRPDDDGGVTVWASTQGTFSVRDGIAQSLKLKSNLVRVVTEHMGGGFGAKFGPSAPGSAFGVEAARAALELKRPVRAMLSRREEHLVAGNRPSSVQTVRLGVNKDGRIAGYTVRMYGTAGLAESGAGAANPMIYDLGATAAEQITVVTHAGPQAAFRAPGHPQGSFALEQAIDEAAFAVGADPLEFRKKLDRNPIRLQQYEEGAKRFDWKRRRTKPPGASFPGMKVRGAGVAAAVWHQQGASGAVVEVIVHRDGSVEVSNGSQDIGTGTRTVLAVIVAEVLGLDVADVKVNLGRTSLPYGPGSGGSTTAPSVGPAARAAAEAALRGVLGEKAPLAPPPSRAAWRAACGKLDGESISFQGRRPDPYQGKDGAFQRGTAGVQFAEVEVEPESGVVRVVHVLAVQDCGRVIDALTAESQVIGGVIGGISYALFEDRKFDPATGRMMNGDLEHYRIAGPRDVPDVDVLLTDVANAGNSVGMMGLGEGPSVPTAGAIANAVFDAIGVRVRRIPMTPATVLAAIEEARTERKGGK